MYRHPLQLERLPAQCLLGGREPVRERRGLGFEPGAGLRVGHCGVPGFAGRGGQFAAQRFGCPLGQELGPQRRQLAARLLKFHPPRFPSQPRRGVHQALGSSYLCDVKVA
ncbi:hypothetical protein LMG23994_06498 [Cupriavidus pinatubonensis]|uniref:Uncharacterized protein n=1 Tax=Cupriavidus pinatubonensis TaxID=248026 RepID=A0ABN7ZTJ9_9BURK|nr:hypothetical protein LMG23994_06498 [Cupriavidus pinatubonensis]